VHLILKISQKHIVNKASSNAKNTKTEDYLRIHLFREIRNSMVHSSVNDFKLPDSTVENSNEAGNNDRVLQLRVALRLILLTIKILTIGYLLQSPLKHGITKLTKKLIIYYKVRIRRMANSKVSSYYSIQCQLDSSFHVNYAMSHKS